MENKKLVKILSRDMSELEELIADVKSQGNFNPLEMDFIHTRAKGLMQLIQLLNVEDENGSVKPPVKSETLQELKETVSEIQEEVTENAQQSPGDIKPEEPEPKKTELPGTEELEENVVNVVKGEPSEDDSDNKVEISEDAVPEKDSTSKEPEPNMETKEDPVKEKEIEEKKDEEDDEMLEEEAERKDSRLGDSFLKGKSVNDLVTDMNKLEFKLSNRPVSSIKTAIGINDRFQYIRELFDGDPEKFVKTVNELDSRQNIKEAVDYLRKNFKWRKSETSLKFVNLVKRRFQHE